jgi:hypothetical protein
MCVLRESQSGCLATHHVQYRQCLVFHFDVLQVWNCFRCLSWADNARYSRCSYRVLQLCFRPEWCYVCRVTHNSQTRFTKSVHLNGWKDFTYRRRTFLSLFVRVLRALAFVGGRQDHLPHRLVGCGTAEDQALLLWPSRSPDLTPCDYL